LKPRRKHTVENKIRVERIALQMVQIDTIPSSNIIQHHPTSSIHPRPTAKDFHHFTQISFHKYKMVSRQSNSTTVRALHPNAKGSPGWPHSEGRAGRMQHATKDMPMGGMATKPMLKISRELPEKITVSMCTCRSETV